MGNFEKSISELKAELRRIADETPEAKRAISLLGLRKIGEIANSHGGIGELFNTNKVILKATERGSDEEAQKAGRELKSLLSTIEAYCELSGVEKPGPGRG